MTSIGDVMLHRARLRFRVPLAPRGGVAVGIFGGGGGVVSLYVEESSVSLFVRHARSSKAVHDRLEVLDGISRKVFPSVLADYAMDGGDDGNDRRDASSTEASPSAGSEATFPDRISDLDQMSSRDDDPSDTVGSCSDRLDVVTPSEVGRALNVALCLLGCPNPDYFVDPHEADIISYHASTTALEWRVHKVCGAIGVKSYKYAKSRMCRRYDREDEIFYNAYHAVTDRMMMSHHDNRPRAPSAAPLDDDDSDYYDDDDDTVDPGDIEAEEDMMLLDKASLVMQHVYLREQDAARRQWDRLPPGPS